MPLTISASNTAGLFNPVTRANWNGQDPRLDGPGEERLQRWFDTSAFSQPAPFTFGNAGAYLVEDDGRIILNLSIAKRFRIVENHSLELRGEFFNFPNTVNLTAPGLAPMFSARRPSA